MGIYDRDYYRDEDSEGGAASGLPQTTVVRLIILNVALYFLDLFLGGPRHALTAALTLTPDDLARPWQWWHLLSYAFAHNPYQMGHLAANMLGLWFFGREVEAVYGRWEFLRIYLAAAFLGGLAWLVRSAAMGAGAGGVMGASGAVIAVVILFALRFPHRQVLFMMFIPMPAWVMGIIYVVADLAAATSGVNSGNIAYDVHLVGAAFAFLYYRLSWNLGRFALPWPRRWAWPRRIALPRWLRWPRGNPLRRSAPGDTAESGDELRIFRPDQTDGSYQDLDARADAVLAKLHQQGDESLTADERRVLEAYSRRMRQKHR